VIDLPEDIRDRLRAPEDIPLRGGRCRCGDCGQTFSGLEPFDMHQVGRYEVVDPKTGTTRVTNTRHCLSLREMVERGMVLDEAGVWRTPGSSGRRSRSRVPESVGRTETDVGG
jgi:hypothetical protein